MNAIAAHPRDRPGNADGSGNSSTLVQDRGGHAARAHVGLLIVDGVALLHDANELFRQPCEIRNGAGSGALKVSTATALRGAWQEESEQRF